VDDTKSLVVFDRSMLVSTDAEAALQVAFALTLAPTLYGTESVSAAFAVAEEEKEECLLLRCLLRFLVDVLGIFLSTDRLGLRHLDCALDSRVLVPAVVVLLDLHDNVQRLTRDR
jgi:hypothetical protein